MIVPVLLLRPSRAGRTSIRWKFDMKRLFLVSMLMWGPVLAYAQQPPNSGSPCPPGMIPGYGKCYSPSDPDLYGPNEQRQRSARPNGAANHGDGWLRYETGKWTESFGALADDGRGVKGSSGRSEDSTSAQAARKEALRDCGKQDCQIRIEVRNGCWAVAYGKSSTFYFGTEIDMVGADPKTAGLKLVSSQAMAMCKQAGDVNCEVRNTSCSLPSQ